MTVTATLEPQQLSVLPGGEATCELKIRNGGTVVDQFAVDVLGDAAEWTKVEPPALSLFPGAEGSVKIFVRPPRSSSSRAGSLPFAVRVVSSTDPTQSTVEEGSLAVGIFSDYAAEIIPRTSRGSRAAVHELAFDNRGNARVAGEFLGADPDNLLTFEFEPPSLTSEPGTATFVKVRVRPRKRFLRGQPKTLPFQVQTRPEGAQQPVITDANFLQEPEVPKWVPKALLGILALALLLVILWFAILKPAVKSTATDAVNDPGSNVGQHLKALDAATGVNGGGAGSGSGGSGSGSGTGTGNPKVLPTAAPVPSSSPNPGGGSGGSGGANPLGAPQSFRATVNTGSPDSATTVPDKNVLSITDVVFQNPQGDNATLVVTAGGQVIFSEELANFRDLDFHFVSPITLTAGKTVDVKLSCRAPGQVPGSNPATAFPNCADAVLFSGFQKQTP